MTREEVLAVIEKHEKLDFKDLKVSYLILKPNAARHYKVIVNEIIDTIRKSSMDIITNDNGFLNSFIQTTGI